MAVDPLPREIAARARHAVVRITASIDGEEVGQGTGFILTADGRLATNYHVIRGANQLAVQLSAGDIYDSVYFVSADERRDLVILQIPATGLDTLALGDDRTAQVGDRVYVMGNPLGLDGTFSDGLVSAKRNVDGVAFMQISAPISPGSSGGPVLNGAGEVIGIATLTLEHGQNLNIAVPSRYVKGLLAMNDEPQPFELVGRSVAPSNSTEGTASARFESELEDWALVLVDEMEQVREAAGKLGYVVTQEPVIEMIKENEMYDVEFTFQDRGANISVGGVCDLDCTDLDLAMYDENGHTVVTDTDLDDRPMLNFEIVQPGTFTVRVYMAKCSREPCAFAVQAYVKSGR
ncbi:MAG: S1C family serine protease [Gammaproteobacteria bacterium]